MDQRALNLSKLTNFILHTLQSTEEVKNIIQSQCDEAKFVLAPWPLETMTRKEIGKESCKCVGVLSTEEHVKDIASGIDRAVAHARQLREKLAINLSEEKKLARRPSVRQIYASSSKIVESKSKIVGPSKPVKEEKGEKKTADSASGDNRTREKDCKNLKSKELHSKEKKSVVETRRPSCSGVKKFSETKKITDKKLVGTSPYNSLVVASKAQSKSKGKKNFIAANKSSVKSMTTATSKGVDASRNPIKSSESSAATKSSDSSISRAASAAEFGNLISKISLESENGLIKSTTNLNKGNGCTVHDINAPKFVEEKIYTTIDVAEGLDRFGVPSELVKVLKLYHTYLNGQSMDAPTNKRGGKATQKFLEEFETMNRARRKISRTEKLDNLCKDFLPVLKESCNKNMDFIGLSKLKICYTNLDSVCKILNVKTFGPTKRKIVKMIENRSRKSSNRTWRLNAVWNEEYIESLDEMSNARCIRYSNRNQLLTLFDFMQQIQRLKYRCSLLDLLINEIVPLVRNSLEPTSEEYVNAFKMISTVSNLLNFRVPVLVRTNK